MSAAFFVCPHMIKEEGEIALAGGFFALPPELMTAIGTVLGFALIGDLTADQQNSLGNFLMLIAQILETNASQLQFLQDLEQDKTISAMQAQLDALQKQVDALTKQG